MCHTRILPNSDSAINSSPDEGGHFGASGVHGDGHTRGDTAAGGDRLGILTSIRYPLPSSPEVDVIDTSTATVTIPADSSGIDTLSAAAMHKRNRYRLQRVAANILGAEWRVNSCLWSMHDGDYDGVAGGVTIQRTVTDEGCGRHYYGGLMTCGSGWTCPVCAARIAAERADELRAAIDAHTAAGGSVCMVTTTIQHRRSDLLADLLTHHKEALQYQRRGAAHRRFVQKFGLVGHARSLEIRVSVDKGWHPHTHEILFVAGDVDKAAVQRAYMARYGAKLEELGYHTVDDVTVKVTGDRDKINDYLTKFALELTAGQDKDGRGDAESFSPFQLLDVYAQTDQRWYADKFREYATATKGRNWFNWSRVTVDGKQVSLYTYLTGDVSLSDEEIAEGDADAEERTEVTLTLTRDEWGRLREKELRASALLVADEDTAKLRPWLIAHGVIRPSGDNAAWRASQARDHVLENIGRPVAFEVADELRRAIDAAGMGDTVTMRRVPLTWGDA